MSDRESVFNSIRKALEPLPVRTGYPEWSSDLPVPGLVTAEPDTARLFSAQLKAAKGVLISDWPALADFLRAENATTGYLGPGLEDARSFLQGFHLEEQIDRERIDEYQFGITLASGAIAESGTLILRDADAPYRLGSLASWIHVAVVRRECIHRTIVDAVTRLGSDPSIVFVTGPSKTADIEGILIEGVHGPGIQAALIL